MKYTDYIYEQIEIDEPVILELINCPAMQRLKGVDQHGYLHNPKNIEFHFEKSRFNHSIGVYILLNKFGAPLEEQIAGLLHDVSHSAFSHCIDLLKGSGEKQDYQDSIHDQYIKNTEIPKILEKYGIDLEYILDDSHFPLKEKDSPDLCADRIDYILRDAVIFEEITPVKAKYFWNNLYIKNGCWVFKKMETAREFKDLFSMINCIYYSGIPTAAMFFSVSNYIRHSLDNKYIDETDLYATDKEVLDKINKYLSQDPMLEKFYYQMNHNENFENNLNILEDKVVQKSRAIDPVFLDGAKLVRISDVDLAWKEQLLKENQPKQYYLHFTKT